MNAKPYSARFMQSLGQVLPPGMTSTGKPGEFNIEGVGIRKFADMRQGVIYDQVSLGASITAGTEYVWFRDTANKNKFQTNMTMQSMLPAGNEAVVYRLNIMPDLQAIPEDIEKIISRGYGAFVMDDDNTRMEGPVPIFGSAYGMYGQMMTTANDSVEGVVSNGVPSPGAQPRRMIPDYIAEGRTFRFSMWFFEAVTLTEAVNCWVILDVLKTRPLR